MAYFLYILRFSNNKLYIGQTDNLGQRLKDHISGKTKSAKFVKNNGNFNFVYKEEYQTRLASMRREKQLKGWTRAKKEALIAGDLDLLKKI
jgi:predicted GIY-YIG superfamily endonuclease